MKNYKLAILPALIGLFMVPIAVNAFTVRSGDAVYISESETVEGNLYAAGANITIDGRITGDVICAGQSVKVSGAVEGDVICVGQSISVTGAVGGNVRAAGSNIDIRGNVERGLTVAGANVEVEKEAIIGWDALIAGATVRLDGEIGRSVLGAGANFYINSNVGQDVVLYADDNNRGDKSLITVADSAVIGGKFDYTAKADASISQKAQITGKVTHNLPPVRSGGAGSKTSGLFGILFFATLSALVLGYALMAVFKKPIMDMADAMLADFWPTIGWGAVWTIITPIIAVLVAFTVIGFRLTLITMWSWLVMLMVSKVVASIAIGSVLLNKYRAEKKESSVWLVTVGVIVSWIVFYIPVIGWFLSLMAVWWGVGAITLYFKKNYDAGKISVK